MSSKLRVFIAEDYNIVREGLKALVSAQPDMEVVGDAADGVAACEGALALGPDVVVMDLSMPALNGAKATERLKQARPEIRVLALTVHEDRTYIRQLLEAGADGYVLKRVVADELIRAIRVVAAGGTYLDPGVAAKVVGGFVQGSPSSGRDAGAGDLSGREEEVLRMIARGHTNKDIAARLDISVKTVETYKTRSMEKLGLAGRADIVRYAVRQGWLTEV
jgi:DNA-binding NarL/FixJ family response regulator